MHIENECMHEITYLEVGYNSCSIKANHFQHKHGLWTDSTYHVAGEELLTVKRDFHLLKHGDREKSCVLVPRDGKLARSLMALTLDIQQKLHTVILTPGMHLRHHEGWTFQTKTSV
jgi:hypothetical protein